MPEIALPVRPLGVENCAVWMGWVHKCLSPSERVHLNGRFAMLAFDSHTVIRVREGYCSGDTYMSQKEVRASSKGMGTLCRRCGVLTRRAYRDSLRAPGALEIVGRLGAKEYPRTRMLPPVASQRLQSDPGGKRSIQKPCRISMNRKHEVKRTMRIGQVLDSRDFSMKRRECITDTSCKRRYLQAAIDVAAFPMGEAHTHRLRTSDRVMAPDDYKPPYGRQGCGHAEAHLLPRNTDTNNATSLNAGCHHEPEKHSQARDHLCASRGLSITKLVPGELLQQHSKRRQGPIRKLTIAHDLTLSTYSLVGPLRNMTRTMPAWGGFKPTPYHPASAQANKDSKTGLKFMVQVARPHLQRSTMENALPGQKELSALMMRGESIHAVFVKDPLYYTLS
ncbi:predicted protein [Postia placenta Mad-698-R]|nr:predicted protein [Postia placenta Mad-698-R]